jgi:hypothetical protein
MLSLGCGGRARCGPEADGIVSPTPHNLHVLPYPPPGSMDALKKANQGLGYTIHIGALGDMAHDVGWTTAVIGNMDSDRPDRSGYLVAMDSTGLVNEAGPRMSKNVSLDTAPFGITANMDETLAAFDGVAMRDHLRVVVAGDLHRADRYSPLCLPGIAKIHRGNALNSVNHLVDQLYERIARENGIVGVFSRLIVIAPGPADSTPSAQDTLAPIVMWGGGISHGEVTSLSTRRKALVVNSDLLATIAAWLNQPLPGGATGRPIVPASTTAATATAAEMRNEHDSFVNTSILQNLLGGLPTVQAVLVIIGFAATAWRPVSWRPASAFVRRAVGAGIVSLPLGMLVLPSIHPDSPAVAGLCLLVFAMLCVAAAVWRTENAAQVVHILCGALVGLVCIDLATGCRLLQGAWMSYSATDGSRFYGIGNEYMGAVIGALAVLFPAFAAQAKAAAGKPDVGSANLPAKPSTANTVYFILFTLMVLLMTAPFAGAKAGAVLSAGAAGAVMLLMDRRGRIIATDLFVAVLSLLIIIAAAALLDAHSSQSHLIRSITGSGGDAITTVIRRKLGMELRLLRHSPWTLTLIAGAAAMAVLGRRLIRSPRHDQKATRITLNGLWCGAAACAIFNDAGVLAAAMVMLYGCAWAFTVTDALKVKPSEVNIQGDLN